MPKTKVAVTLESDLLEELDPLVRQRRTRLAAACALLNPEEERAIAEEGLGVELDSWPAY